MIYLLALSWVLCWVFAMWVWINYEDELRLLGCAIMFLLAPVCGFLSLLRICEEEAFTLNPIVFRRRK